MEKLKIYKEKDSINKTEVKANLLSLIGLSILVLSLLSVTLISAQEVTVCCEKTNSGAWCQNTPEENCDTGFRITPTSCKSTSFCKPGCCIDTDEGLCMENTPQRVCEEGTGTWEEDEECNIPQCDLGCCILGDQASFVTLTRCKKLSGFYGLETNFNLNIGDEASCILTAQFQDRGACVFESENQRTCKFTTRGECLNLRGRNITSGSEFFKNYLCSADELATNCGPTTETICIPGKDEVYFKDSCGNPANIYDANKIYSKNSAYWQQIVSKANSCGFGDENGNAGSSSCGNCDYFFGSICGKGSATYGNNICKDLNCKENGVERKNGESWCEYKGTSVVGLGSEAVGSRHIRKVCFSGEITTEPCADFRNEICLSETIETTQGDFTEAACRVNRWSDCIDQDEKEDCLNSDKRDCYWLPGFSFKGALTGVLAAEGESSAGESNSIFSGGETGGFLGGLTESLTGGVIAQEEGVVVKKNGGICLPDHPIGLKFWNSVEAQGVCSFGNAVCDVKYEKGLTTGFDDKCTENCQCMRDDWAIKMNNVCTSIGDCGAYVNAAGKFTDDGAEWKIGKEKKVITGLLESIRAKAGGGSRR